MNLETLFGVYAYQYQCVDFNGNQFQLGPLGSSFDPAPWPSLHRTPDNVRQYAPDILDVCTPTAKREKGKKCVDGVDNDCDGLIDLDDPDCF